MRWYILDVISPFSSCKWSVVGQGEVEWVLEEQVVNKFDHLFLISTNPLDNSVRLSYSQIDR